MSYRAYIPSPLTIFFLSFTFPLALDLLQQLIDARALFVSRKSNFSNRDHGQSRVFQFVADNLSNLLLDRICRSFRPTHFRTCALDASLECADLSAPGPAPTSRRTPRRRSILTAPWPRLAPRHTPQSGRRFLRR